LLRFHYLPEKEWALMHCSVKWKIVDEPWRTGQTGPETNGRKKNCRFDGWKWRVFDVVYSAGPIRKQQDESINKTRE
jgi:hypothetical protein